MSRLLNSALAAALWAAAATAQAALAPLADELLDGVTGQATFNLSSQDKDGLNFQRLTIAGTLEYNLNIDEFKLGQYARNKGSECFESSCTYHAISDWSCNTPDCEKKKWDIDIRRLSYGRVENGNIIPFKQENPYFEFAFEGAGASRKVVGFRMGAGKTEGDLSNSIINISAGLLPHIRADLFGAQFDANLTGIRTEGYGELDPLFHMKQKQMLTSSVQGGDVPEWQRITNMKNFFLSLQSRPINYPSTFVDNDHPTPTAQRGFWLNLSDGLFSDTKKPNGQHAINHFIPIASTGGGVPNTPW